MPEKLQVGVLHGAIKNSGDYLIYQRGYNHLSFGLNMEKIDLVPIKRWQRIDKDLNAIIVLGGPLISRKLHIQTRNIKDYLKTKEIPVIPLGLGISGEKFKSEDKYFKNEEAISFWRNIYNSSKLFSVRDITTQQILGSYGIETKLTGCPALFDPKTVLDSKAKRNLKENFYHRKIAVTIPNLKFLSLRNFGMSVYLLYLLKRKFSLDSDITVIFQHGTSSLQNKLISLMAKNTKLDICDASNISLDEISDLREIDLHIGTRLHAAIFYLSLRKPSYLFDIDLRTRAFSQTIAVPYDKFSFNGISRLISQLELDLFKPEDSIEKFNAIYSNIDNYYCLMVDFIESINYYFAGLLDQRK